MKEGLKEKKLNNKESFFSKLRERELNKLRRKRIEVESSSNSRFFFQYFINRTIDLAGWIIIGFFVYVWWNVMGQDMTCDRISVELCNHCFAKIKMLLSLYGI